MHNPLTANRANKPTERLPEWVRRSVLNTEDNRQVRSILKEQRLNTICESGRCPNKGECWAAGTATFMLMGEICTRTCRFCAVNKGLPGPLDPNEPQRIVNACLSMKLKHVVLTSVNRDDLPDQGSAHFAATITALKENIPHITVEVLTPDFQGREDCLVTVLAAAPAVFNHNLETVPRLYKQVRPGSKYDRSLTVLANAKRLTSNVTSNINSNIPTKSGIMLGLGERKEEIEEVLHDLRAHNCDILTLGQYLRPSLDQLPVDRYVTPEEFEHWAQYAQTLGFMRVHSGPLVRSSYHAAEFAQTV